MIDTDGRRKKRAAGYRSRPEGIITIRGVRDFGCSPFSAAPHVNSYAKGHRQRVRQKIRGYGGQSANTVWQADVNTVSSRVDDPGWQFRNTGCPERLRHSCRGTARTWCRPLCRRRSTRESRQRGSSPLPLRDCPGAAVTIRASQASASAAMRVRERHESTSPFAVRRRGVWNRNVTKAPTPRRRLAHDSARMRRMPTSKGATADRMADG